jgi:NAD(P)H-hydrate epimerase
MRAWEQTTWKSGRTEQDVIRQVGHRLAEKVEQLTTKGSRVLFVAGPGHNGDDARAAREFLTDRDADYLNISDPVQGLGELNEKLANKPSLIVDAIFGIGLNRPVEGAWAELITRINTSRIPVLAVDIPSGLNAETGEPLGVAIEAAVTLTVGAIKTGMLSQNAWRYVGQIEVATNVGLLDHPHTDLLWTTTEDFENYPPPRESTAHKGSYGHLAIVAGSMGCHGAAVLAARGAQRARPGLITLHTAEAVYYPVAAQLQSVMVSTVEAGTKLQGPWSGILVGPGLAALGMTEQMKLLARFLWRDSTLPVVVDASAIDWLPADVILRGQLRVITPHPGEAARILRTTPQAIQANRIEAVRHISRQFGNCWVVLKGYQTIIGRSTGELWINSSGNPGLAQGGSGDLLAGFIAGLLAQPVLQKDASLALRYAVWEHGAAADRLTRRKPNWIIEELVEELGDR